MTHAVVSVVLVPLAGAIVVSLVPGPRERARRAIAVASAALHCAVVAWIALSVSRSAGLVYEVGGWAAPLGIVLAADALTAFFLLVLCAGHLLFVVHALSEERGPRKPMWILTQLLVAALSGILVAADLFNLFVFLELASVSSVGLMARKQRAEGAGAGFVYLIYTSISGVLFLIAVVVLYRFVGALSFRHVASLGDEMPMRAYRAVVGLLTVSLGMKFGLVPFHFWQAPAYDAAGSSAAALLSGTAMKVYLYALIRLLAHVLRAHETAAALAPVILVLGSVNILAGHTLALAERDLKRLLAYSSVAHAGYILVALSAVLTSTTATVLAASAALLHAAFHALMKTTLFYSGRSLIVRSGSSTVERLRGVARLEPIGFAAFILAALSLVGIPPASGFYSKWRIGLGVTASYGWVPVAVIAAGTVVSMVYYARVLHVGLAEPPHAATARPAIGHPTRALLVVLAAACVLLGVFGPGVEAALARAATAIAEPAGYLALLGG